MHLKKVLASPGRQEEDPRRTETGNLSFALKDKPPKADSKASKETANSGVTGFFGNLFKGRPKYPNAKDDFADGDGDVEQQEMQAFTNYQRAKGRGPSSSS